ncbi:unnamed protein product [Phyllotreta striolata]|uniref:Uncharacterized protein n=1 Tax=Phyllotreta striolata TaxID=444603 RepID=A0A9N9U083_PHYSR|nr:unnamed protein product [Phyllotreta striolata]
MLNHRTIVWLLLCNLKLTLQQSYQIEDIPIEHYVHEDVRRDEIDVELMPRTFDKLQADESEQITAHETPPCEHPTAIKRPKREIDTRNSSGNLNKTLTINDFIKFKRSVAPDSRRTGATPAEQQWTDESIRVSSEAARAPRAHFVTNGMPDRNPLQYKFDREPRSESTKYLQSDLPDEYDYHRPPSVRNRVSRTGRYNPSTYDRYPASDRRSYYRRQEYPEKPYYDPDYNEVARKRRIIYYATLPEAPRKRMEEPRRLQDRYRYRDVQDYRLFAPETYNGYRKREFDYPRRVFEIFRTKEPVLVT